ncbi:MAG TPA: hypothetical protein VLR49_02140, partial [Ferruginibacter sp.]|nr:hypothetical protein [Ferruginibacter sp.]
NEKRVVIDSLKAADRYFILRSGGQAYAMNKVSLSADQKFLTCVLDKPDFDHKLHLVKGKHGKMQYDKNVLNDLSVLNEVHFYIVPDTAASFGQYTLALDQIQKIEIIEKDKKRTTNSYVVGVIGSTLGVLAIVAVIALATKSSCPFVSAYDGEQFTFQGEIYGGAIYPQLVRHDYMPLKMAPLADGSLQIKISNELREHQYTDIAELWVITHDKNTKVFADEQGNLYQTSQAQLPAAAYLNEKKEVMQALLKANDNALVYMDDTSFANASNEIVMKFPGDAGQKNARLMLSLKNSYFLDLLYGELAKGFGNYYGTYIKQQQKKPAAELLQWVKDQNIPLEVSVNTKEGWKKVADLTTIGPLATRNIVVPITLPANTGSFTEIKLSSGFMFWEIDYAALDYSVENNFSVQKLLPAKATDEGGKDVLPFVKAEDASYLSQPDIGNTATIVYRVEELKDESKTRSYILHSKGYYEHIRNFSNEPNLAFLNQFKKPGAFPLYGLGLYKKINKDALATMAKNN